MVKVPFYGYSDALQQKRVIMVRSVRLTFTRFVAACGLTEFREGVIAK